MQRLVAGGDERLVATAETDGTVQVWDTDREVQLATMVLAGPCRALGFTGDGRYLVTVTYDDSLQLWDLSVLLQEPAALMGRVSGETGLGWEGGEVVLVH